MRQNKLNSQAIHRLSSDPTFGKYWPISRRTSDKGSFILNKITTDFSRYLSGALHGVDIRDSNLGNFKVKTPCKAAHILSYTDSATTSLYLIFQTQ